MNMPGNTVQLPQFYYSGVNYRTIPIAGVNTQVKFITTNYDPTPTTNAIPSGVNPTPFPNATAGWYSYQINYDAVLNWIKNTGTNPFPNQLRAGGILYYASIPTTVGTPSGNMPVASQANRDARFWKEYIDYCCGLYQDPWGNWYDITQFMGFGADVNGDFWTAQSSTNPFPLSTSSWTGVMISQKPATQTFTMRTYQYGPGYRIPNSTTSFTQTDTGYMDYRDQPPRPVAKYWFGPLTMIDFLGNYNYSYWLKTQGIGTKFWWPGTSHEAPLWQLKTGVQSALGDVRNNHPNDYLSVIAFSTPTDSAGNPGTYNSVLWPLSQNYNSMTDVLWFPQYLVNNFHASPPDRVSEITPYDYAYNSSTGASTLQTGVMASVPRSLGGTCSPFSLMLAYNQFSSDATTAAFGGGSTTPYYGQAGGLGRNGAQKMVMFETDGVASATATGSASNFDPAQQPGLLVAQGAASYFKVRQTANPSPPNPLEYPDYVFGPPDSAVTQTMKMADLITNYTNNPTSPGFATFRKPVKINCIAFGSLFYPGNNAIPPSGTQPAQTEALNLLQYMQYKGAIQASASTPLAASRIINQSVWDDGSSPPNPATCRKGALQQAFSQSMQDTVGVVLIR
jgi:hypothetical protein